MHSNRKTKGNFVCYSKSYCMAYHPHKAVYILSIMLSLGELKLNWVSKLCYLGIYFVNNPNLGLTTINTKFFKNISKTYF